MAEKAAKKKANILVRMKRGVVRFFRDTKGEMKKVVWPGRKQVRNNFIVVMIFVIVMGLFIAGLDLLFGAIFQLLVGLASGGAAAA